MAALSGLWNRGLLHARDTDEGVPVDDAAGATGLASRRPLVLLPRIRNALDDRSCGSSLRF